MVQHRGFNRRRREALMFPLFIIHCSFFIVSSWWDVVWNAGWRSLLKQMSEEEHLKEIEDVVGDEGVWFNTEVLIAVGVK